jgi:hypothetical protein
MKRVLWCAVLVGCGGGGSGDDFPVEPGGPSGPSTPLDASLRDASDPDALATLMGRVCLALDLRAPVSDCATTGADGITVTLGTKMATTTADGTFVIERPSGSSLVWRARGLAIVSSVMPFGASNIIPAMGLQDYVDLQNANTITVVTGSIIARVVKNGTLQAGVNATVTPPADTPPHYAGNGELVWPELANGTTAFGMIWIPNARLEMTTVTGTPDAGAFGTAAGIVEDQSITYLTIDLP